MIITTQTAYGFALLLLNSFASGIALSMLYLLLMEIPAIVGSCKALSNGYGKFNECVKCQCRNRVFTALADFLICIVSACVVCFLIFIFYGGQFRFASVAVFCLGFFWGKMLLSELLRSIVTLISFALIKVILIVFFPAVWLIRIICRAIGRIVERALTRHKLSLMKKYTKEQFDKLERLQEFGLVEQGYKELIK